MVQRAQLHSSSLITMPTKRMSSGFVKAGIYIPIVPGIAPVGNFKAIAKFADKCGTHIPQWLAERFEGLENDPKTSALVASAVAAEQVMDLVERGIEDFHFYTMNKADLVFAICHQLGLRPNGQSKIAA